MHPYERFAAWRLAHQLVLVVYQATRSWPREELFGLIAQTRRAAVSAPANLAEGSARRGPREFGRFLDIANGSIAELGYHLRLAYDLGYLSESAWSELDARRDEAARARWGLYASVRRRHPSA